MARKPFIGVTTRYLDAITAFIEKTGRSPTIRELMQVLDVKSTATVDYHLRSLEKRELIKRPRTVCGKARPITSVRGAAVCCPTCGKAG